jgi:hypothetical protein
VIGNLRFTGVRAKGNLAVGWQCKEGGAGRAVQISAGKAVQISAGRAVQVSAGKPVQGRLV